MRWRPHMLVQRPDPASEVNPTLSRRLHCEAENTTRTFRQQHSSGCSHSLAGGCAVGGPPKAGAEPMATRVAADLLSSMVTTPAPSRKGKL